MVFGHMPLHDLHLMLGATVAYRLPHPRPHFTSKNRLAVLGRIHHMQMNFEYRMRAESIVWHLPSVLGGALAKTVALRRGLQPSQTGTVNKLIQRNRCSIQSDY